MDKELWYIYKKKYYSAIKRKASELVLMRWRNLEPIIQNEVSQKEKNKYILTAAWHRNNCEEIPHLQWQRSPSKMVGTGAAAAQGKNNMSLKDEFPGSVGAQYATGDQWRNNSRKNEGMEPKQKQHRIVDMNGDGNKA